MLEALFVFIRSVIILLYDLYTSLTEHYVILFHKQLGWVHNVEFPVKTISVCIVALSVYINRIPTYRWLKILSQALLPLSFALFLASGMTLSDEDKARAILAYGIGISGVYFFITYLIRGLSTGRLSYFLETVKPKPINLPANYSQPSWARFFRLLILFVFVLVLLFLGTHNTP